MVPPSSAKRARISSNTLPAGALLVLKQKIEKQKIENKRLTNKRLTNKRFDKQKIDKKKIDKKRLTKKDGQKARMDRILVMSVKNLQHSRNGLV